MIHAAPRAALALTLGLVCASCASSGPPPALQGRIASGGGFLGDWDFYPVTCAVHNDEVVLIESPSSLKRVRLVDRTRAPSTRNAKIDVHVAKATPSGSMDLVFTDPNCVQSSLQGGPKGYAGTVSLDCKTGEGGHVVGKITFDGCR
jgi:hypothetical protein